MTAALEHRLRLAATRELADEWALVLFAIELSPSVTPETGGFALAVPIEQAERAEAALLAYERENRRVPAAHPVELHGRAPLLAALGTAGALLLFYSVTGPWDPSSPWFIHGAADAEDILAGELWRTVTALTLHADLRHALGNALAGAVFLSAVGRVLGPGLGLALSLVAGAEGNLVNALLRPAAHVSVGASTAVFAALGLLAGVGIVRRGRSGARGRQLWVPLAAALALLAMLGSAGERVDLGAHLFGLSFGLAFGGLAALASARIPGARVQWASAVGVAGVIVSCWSAAFS